MGLGYGGQRYRHSVGANRSARTDPSTERSRVCAHITDLVQSARGVQKQMQPITDPSRVTVNGGGSAVSSISKSEPEEDAGVAASRAAAWRIMNETWDPVSYEPSGAAECHAAVEELGMAFRSAGKTFEEVVANSRAGAESLSTDTFQGLSEVVQNADDVAASKVSFSLIDSVLEVHHNGRPVSLRDLRAMAVPWLTTKADVSDATGRFGVGLSTLHRFAATFEVHSGDYHVRVGDPFVTNIDLMPGDSAFVDETVLRVVFRDGAATENDFVQWYEQWDDSALMFLNHAHQVVFSTPSRTRTLELRRKPIADIDWHLTTRTSPERAVEVAVVVQNMRAPDGRSWLLASCDVPSPDEVDRIRKKKGETTPLGVALPLFRGTPQDGMLYAGLPVVGLPGVPALFNAQFDPFTTRQGLQASDWNFALAAFADRLWLRTVEYLFAADPRKAWHCVPLLQSLDDDDGSQANQSPESAEVSPVELAVSLVTLIRERCVELGSVLQFEIDGLNVALGEMAVETAALTGLLDDSEVTTLAGLSHRLPDHVRDDSERWRDVLDGWRRQNLLLPQEVTISDALTFLDDPSDREVRKVIALTAIALDNGLESRLETLACILDDEGQGHRPPRATTAHVLTRDHAGLAHSIGIGIALHPDYLTATDSSVRVIEWLVSTERLIGSEDIETLERLAAAGHAENPVEAPMTDAQVQSIRLAMEPLGATEWTRLGRDIGRAVFLDAFTYSSSGDREETQARPCDAYQPKRIDTIRDGFASAAGATPGITWVANKYQDILRSSLGRDQGGLGAQRFLRALGCLTAPRLVPHPSNYYRYTDPRQGLARVITGSPHERGRAMLDLEASFTLDDIDSPDLAAVLVSIAAEKNARRRRDRAVAILNTLGRAWRDLGDSAIVDAAHDSHYWRQRGQIRAFWLWRAASIPWMDNAAGAPTAPSHLRRLSESTRALFGNDPNGLIHEDFAAVRPEILTALGVSGEPKTPDLIRRLLELRDGDQTDETLAECGIIYQALATRLDEGRTSIGLTDKQLREQLAQGSGLIRTATRWAPPAELRRGKPIFGGRRDFTPSIPRTERLWDALLIQRPTVDDCLKVLNEIAKAQIKPTPRDETIVIETLRALDDLLRTRGTSLARSTKEKLRLLPLWTSSGWRTKRPIYTTQDPQIIDGIGSAFPVWDPGVDSAQFQGLFTHLRVTPIGSDQIRVHQADLAATDDKATRAFGQALNHFKADLTRNDPAVVDTLAVGWASLATYEVRVHPRLQANVTLDAAHNYAIPIRAIVEVAQSAIYVRDPQELERVDGVGRAIATLFTGDARTVSHAWLAAVQAEREGQAAEALILAAEQQARQASDAEDRMSRLNTLSSEAAAAADKAATKKAAVKKVADGKNKAQTKPSVTPEPVRKPRYLVDPDLLVVTDTGGMIVNGTGPTPNKARPKASRTADTTGGGSPGGQTNNAPVDTNKPPPKKSTSYRAYTEDDKERLGLEIASRVLKGDERVLVDIRNQRGVGADAIDDLRRFYELKVFAGEELNTIALEPSQIRLAMTEPNFFLVIVSNLEGKNAHPQVRVISDPLGQLTMNTTSRVTFSGLQEATGLLFTLDRPRDEETD